LGGEERWHKIHGKLQGISLTAETLQTNLGVLGGEERYMRYMRYMRTDFFSLFLACHEGYQNSDRRGVLTIIISC